MKTSMKTILLGILTIATTTLVLTSTTFGYFMETETSIGNRFTVATFDLVKTDTYSLPFQVFNALPGWSGEEIEELINAGSVPINVYIVAANFIEPVEPPEPDNGIGVNGWEVGPLDFADIVHMEVYRSIRPEGPWIQIYSGSLRYLDTRPNITLLEPGYGSLFKFVASLPTDLNDEDDIYEDTPGGIPPEPIGDVQPIKANEDDNAYQADGVVCDIVFCAI